MSAGGKRRFGAVRSAAAIAGAFAVGAVPTGQIVTRALTGKSLGDLGDGKRGSSNVARSVGWKAGAFVLAFDALKAYVPARLARRNGAGDDLVAAMSIAGMCGHVAVVKGRGAACALGAAFAMDTPAMAAGCVPLVGGSLMHRHAQGVTATALLLPLLSLAIHRNPRKGFGPLILISILFAVRLRGSAGTPLPTSPGVYWNRFMLDRDER